MNMAPADTKSAALPAVSGASELETSHSENKESKAQIPSSTPRQLIRDLCTALPLLIWALILLDRNQAINDTILSMMAGVMLIAAAIISAIAAISAVCVCSMRSNAAASAEFPQSKIPNLSKLS